MLQTNSRLQWCFSWRLCKGKRFKPAPVSNEAFVRGSVKKSASNQLQLHTKLSQRICKGRCSKPSPASNEAFPKVFVKERASNQLHPQMKPMWILKDLWSHMLQTSSSLKPSLSWRICKTISFKSAPAYNEINNLAVQLDSEVKQMLLLHNISFT